MPSVSNPCIQEIVEENHKDSARQQKRSRDQVQQKWQKQRRGGGAGIHNNIFHPRGFFTMIKSEPSCVNGYGGSRPMNYDDDTWQGHDQQCCLVENGRRCHRLAGNASYSKRIQKTVTQRKLKLHMDDGVKIKGFPGKQYLVGDREMVLLSKSVFINHAFSDPMSRLDTFTFATTIRSSSKVCAPRGSVKIRKMIPVKRTLSTLRLTFTSCRSIL